MAPLDQLFFGCNSKCKSPRKIDAMSDSVSVDASTTQELLKTMKSLQSDMAELKSRSNGVNDPPNQTKLASLSTLLQINSKVHGKSPPCKRPRDEEDVNSRMTSNSAMKTTTCSCCQRSAAPSWRQRLRAK